MDVTAQIFQTAQTYGVDPRIAYEVAIEESNANPDAPDGSAGEIGMFQVKPSTGQGLGFSVADLRDPVKNIQAGVMYLAQMMRAFGGDAAKAIAGYNAGPGTVQAAVSQGADNWFSLVPSSTQGYVQSVLNAVNNGYSIEAGGTQFAAAVGGISFAAIAWILGLGLLLTMAAEAAE